MDEIRKSLANQAPYDGRPGSTTTETNNDYGVLLFTGGAAGSETGHAANELPAHWSGVEVGLMCKGGTCFVAFSKNPAAEVDRSVAATQAGVAGKVGVPIPDSHSVEARMRLPRAQPGEKLYFVRESDTVGTVVRIRILGP